MELTHSFTVPAAVEETWAALTDPDTVAGCFPGALLASVEGGGFTGSCRVELGPIALVYTGTGRFAQRDESTRRFVVEAEGTDEGGNGTAAATVTAVLSSSAGTSTDVEVATGLSITGEPAQLGRGLVQDASDMLLEQFVAALVSRVGEPENAATPADAAATVTSDQPGAAPTDPAAPAGGMASDPSVDTQVAATAAASGAAGVAAGPQPPVPGRAPGSDERPDLGATTVPGLLRSYGKQVAATVAVLVVLKKLLGGRRR